jgi:hypothetical protein
MKIIFNIQKKHLIFLVALLLIIGVGIVLGTYTTWYNAGSPPSHDTLWAQEIRSKMAGVDEINIFSNLDLFPNDQNKGSIKAFGMSARAIAAQDVAIFGTLSVTRVAGWDDDADGFIDQAYGGNDCNDDNPDVRPDLRNPDGTIKSKTPDLGECSNRIDYNCDTKLTTSDGTLCGTPVKQAPYTGAPKIFGGSPLIMKVWYEGGEGTTTSSGLSSVAYVCSCTSNAERGWVCLDSAPCTIIG